MARMVKVNKNEAREKYSYFAYPKKLDRTFQAMVIEEAAKYGLENVKDVMRNILMEAVVYYEKKHRYIEAREWASANWQKARFTDLTATNLEEKMKNDQQKLMEQLRQNEEQLRKNEEEQKRIKKQLESLVI